MGFKTKQIISLGRPRRRNRDTAVQMTETAYASGIVSMHLQWLHINTFLQNLRLT